MVDGQSSDPVCVVYLDKLHMFGSNQVLRVRLNRRKTSPSEALKSFHRVLYLYFVTSFQGLLEWP